MGEMSKKYLGVGVLVADFAIAMFFMLYYIFSGDLNPIWFSIMALAGTGLTGLYFVLQKPLDLVNIKKSIYGDSLQLVSLKYYAGMFFWLVPLLISKTIRVAATTAQDASFIYSSSTGIPTLLFSSASEAGSKLLYFVFVPSRIEESFSLYILIIGFLLFGALMNAYRVKNGKIYALILANFLSMIAFWAIHYRTVQTITTASGMVETITFMSPKFIIWSMTIRLLFNVALIFIGFSFASGMHFATNLVGLVAQNSLSLAYAGFLFSVPGLIVTALLVTIFLFMISGFRTGFDWKNFFKFDILKNGEVTT